MGTALAELPDDAPLTAVLAAVRPVLGGWWPNGPVSAAIEHLRQTAIHRTSEVTTARSLAASDYWIPTGQDANEVLPPHLRRQRSDDRTDQQQR